MEDAKALVRQAVRAIYSPEQVVIIDVLSRHEILSMTQLRSLSITDDHRSLRKSCAELARGRIVCTRQLSEDESYLFIDYYQAVHAIQYMIYEIGRQIREANVSESTAEIVRRYTCPFCTTTWPLIDVIDNVDCDGSFLCKRCVAASILIEDPVRPDPLPRFNEQFAPFLHVLNCIDSSDIPRVTFEDLYAEKYPDGDGASKRQGL
ncbi:transcription initiation factor tfiie (alpha subunit)-like protein [Colletotrichum incanum]|uniref:Transcription initiation factor tfiie (Alpha subunit)-like protein n=1 Tax=Colletotrichum incanum TaxID=1573173 RepID=A0A167BM23_COLIC|nr:transcription initiation factor tfiie (alpha subunit)-like protein [Colletotrichum incanum]